MRLPSFIERVLLLNDSLMVEWKIDPFERSRHFDGAHQNVAGAQSSMLVATNCVPLIVLSCQLKVAQNHIQNNNKKLYYVYHSC